MALELDPVGERPSGYGALTVIGERALVAPAQPRLPVPAEPPPPPPEAETGTETELIGGVNVRRASPREIADISLDLYAAGLLTYEDYTELAFQPELHPDYNRTVGALTGEPAEPDRARDFVHLWNERLQFDLRHNPVSAPSVKQATRIYELLKGLAQRTRITA
jgi:hypothetical protein